MGRSRGFLLSENELLGSHRARERRVLLVRSAIVVNFLADLGRRIWFGPMPLYVAVGIRQLKGNLPQAIASTLRTALTAAPGLLSDTWLPKSQHLDAGGTDGHAIAIATDVEEVINGRVKGSQLSQRKPNERILKNIQPTLAPA